MIKYKKPDLLAILRLFRRADDNHGLRDIDQVSMHATDDQSTLVSFRFEKGTYFLLTDHRAHDEANYIESMIQPFASGDGSLLVNPTAHDSYGMPYKGKEVYLFYLPPSKVRLDKELSARHPEVSRSTLQKYIKLGYVSVNDDTVTVPKTEIMSSARISLSIPTGENHSEKTFPIIYIDDNVIVVDKPIGVLTHSKGVLSDEFTIADFFRRYTTFAVDSNRPGIVHRLDRDTSGVIIGARNEDTASYLKDQFSRRKVKKTYYAVLDGIPKLHQAIIDVPIGRNPSLPAQFKADPKGKSAVTEYQVVRTHGNRSLVRLSPRTGRTHQLRVHMAHIGTPILGDKVYGRAAERLYLHAAELSLGIPNRVKPAQFQSPVPTEFDEALA